MLFGGMSILAGHITAEKLTKFILYSEWLIFATWWVGDNISNLMQSVGASEKVFHLMDLSSSSQFVARGKCFMPIICHISINLVHFVLPLIFLKLFWRLHVSACSIFILLMDQAWIFSLVKNYVG